MDLQYSTSENYSSSFRDSPSNWSHKDGKGYVYKKSSYQYSSSGNKNTSYMDKSAESNIDQLDELLEDLKNERKHTKDIDLVPSTNIYKTIERESTETPEPPRTTRMLKSSQYSETTKHVPIEYEKAVSPAYSSRAGTLRRDDYHMRDVNYGSNRNIVESSFESTLDSSVDSLAPKMKSSTTHLAKDLQNLTLTDDILPLPGTKVTTTVRTYTYEIPAETGGDPASSRSLVYKNNNSNYFNSVQHTDAQSLPARQPPTLPPAIVYNTESYATLKKSDEQQHHPHYVVHTKEIRDNMVTTNMSGRHEYAASPPPSLPLPLPLPLPQQLGGNSNAVKHQVIYKENTTENVQMLPEAAVYPRNVPPLQPPASSSPSLNYTPGPTINKYYYHESSSNVVNKINEPMGNNNNNMAPPPKHPQGGGGGGGGVSYPGSHAPMSSVVYKYSSTHQGPDYNGISAPLSQPAPFPVEGVNFSSTDGVPPQKVDELMQSFGNGDVTNRGDMEIMHRKREVETSVATPNSQKIPSINRAGKEVYYPPGHDMMIMQREEMASGSSAGGRWAKKSGMYEYESGYKSKSKTKTGGAVVPVCLPLCCAMPCSIM